jgi:two-component system, LuxR family, response regulator FixJ
MGDKLIAVVDGDADYRDSVKFVLEIDGFRVRAYENGAGLLQEAALRSFDCLIIDYHMPDMNGLDLVRRLVERGLTTPIILISSDPSRITRQRASAAGCPLKEKTTLARTIIDDVRSAIASSTNRIHATRTGAATP